MNILITGYLGSMAASLAGELLKAKNNSVIVAGGTTDKLHLSDERITIHPIRPVDPLFREIVSSNDLDAVLFIPFREEQILAGEQPSGGQFVDDLTAVLEQIKERKKMWFILLSSSEAASDEQTKAISEGTVPLATLNRTFIQACEQRVQYYQHKYGLNTSIVRVPFVYGNHEKYSILFKTLEECAHNPKVTGVLNKDIPCDFLHADDVADFIQRLLGETYHKDYQIFQLGSSGQITFGEVATLIGKRFPKTKFNFPLNNICSTKPIQDDRAKAELNWVALHILADDLQSLVEDIQKTSAPKKTFFHSIQSTFSARPSLLKWIELILGGIAMQGLVFLTGTLVQFKYIDFRLLYVILIGSAYGIRFGLLAALIAGASNLYSWYQLGLDWELLIYHVENWLPFALYLIAGSVTGYLWDKKENETNFANKQLALIHEKYNFLYNIFEDTRKTKNQLRDQLIGYRDSYGRIYTITRELDSLNANDVFLKAVDIVEDVMENKSVAIYSLDPSTRFARLEVSSTAQVESTPKSINLDEFPEAFEKIKNGELFINTALLPAYPSLIAPITKEQQPLGMIFIWKRTFEQHSMYYENLFKVISGLIESSLVRAVLFREANLSKWYLPSTRILEADVFKETLKIKMEMQNRDITKFQLISIDKGEKSWKDFSAILEKGIRSTDYAGLLNASDQVCYVILSQAEEASIDTITQRLSKLGLHCSFVESNSITNV